LFIFHQGKSYHVLDTKKECKFYLIENKMSKSQSKYWKDMFVSQSSNTEKDEENTIISVETPIDFEKNYDELKLEIYHSVDDLSKFESETLAPKKIPSGEIINRVQRKTLFSKIGNELIQFIRNHNQMYTGIYELIDEKLLKSLFRLNIYVFILRYQKTNKIMGCMMTVIFDTTTDFKKDDFKSPFALTSYLCIHKQLRSKGVCMLIIRKALQTAYIENIYCSYYLEEKAFSTSGLLVKRWMRPINVQSAISKGFKFELPSEREKTKRRLAYRIPILGDNFESITIDEKNKDNIIEKSFDFLRSSDRETRDKWIWKPTFEEWKGWVTSDTFETIALASRNSSSRKSEIVGLITIQYKQIYVPKTQTTSDIAFIPFHILNTGTNGNSVDIVSKELLNAAIIRCSERSKNKDLNIDMLYAFECGGATCQTLTTSKFVPAGGMYVDFYNFNNFYECKDIFLPLL